MESGHLIDADTIITYLYGGTDMRKKFKTTVNTIQNEPKALFQKKLKLHFYGQVAQHGVQTRP